MGDRVTGPSAEAAADAKATARGDRPARRPRTPQQPALPDYSTYRGLQALNVLTLEYQELQRQLADLTAKKEEVSKATLALLQKAHIPEGGGVLCNGFSVRVTTVRRTTLSKELLLKAGVRASVLERCSITTPSTFASIRALASAQEDAEALPGRSKAGKAG